ncbi:hypothetical protein B0H17DRAFT_1132021 [Mycena rosella]|uniref:Uncharacterized protein n=1 Tax=Mycena rosella TaxID=1033263 RepID=A0AAD7DL93_MYCRO|nr:hypothetical protein B0H17DRAFT_1132021 [Mycena rosella]
MYPSANKAFESSSRDPNTLTELPKSLLSLVPPCSAIFLKPEKLDGGSSKHFLRFRTASATAATASGGASPIRELVGYTHIHVSRVPRKAPHNDTELHWLNDRRARCTTVVRSLYALKNPTVPCTQGKDGKEGQQWVVHLASRDVVEAIRACITPYPLTVRVRWLRISPTLRTKLCRILDFVNCSKKG